LGLAPRVVLNIFCSYGYNLLLQGTVSVEELIVGG
jgi:hypothetical protein